MSEVIQFLYLHSVLVISLVIISKYSCSAVTEEEIIEGIRKNERRRERCIAFIRELTDINMKHDLAWRFVDMEGGKVDTEAQGLLTKLR